MRILRSNLLRGFCALTVVAAAPLHAQRAVVARPDTAGAAFDHATPGSGAISDYDFLIGEWDFTFQARDPATGTYLAPQRGRWIAQKVKESLIADEFYYDVPGGRDASLMTYRVFDAARKQWQVQGVRVRRGVWQPGISWSDPGARYLVQDNPERGLKVRIKYYAIGPDSFLWRADGSNDGGTTWMRDVMLIEARRVGRP